MIVWIQRAAALAYVIVYCLIAPGGRYLPATVWWFAMGFGLLLVCGAEFLDDHFGATSGASYVVHIKVMGWTALLGPLAWDLMVVGLFSAA